MYRGPHETRRKTEHNGPLLILHRKSAVTTEPPALGAHRTGGMSYAVGCASLGRDAGRCDFEGLEGSAATAIEACHCHGAR